MSNESIPEQYLRISGIVGNPKANPPVPGIVPVSPACWWNWVANGRAPKPIKIGRTTMWRRADVIEMIENAAKGVV